MAFDKLKIGFARLSDCASLVVAKERGDFEKYGLEVELQRCTSWAAMRDALAHGSIDAAHMLAPMVVASAAGLGPYPGQFLTAFALNLNGNGITVSNSLFKQLADISPESLNRRPYVPNALKTIVEKRRRAGAEPLTFAQVYHYSMHGYELRYWLAAAGIDPDTDVKLVVIPPEQMVESLRKGLIDGYCVGEPWNSAAIQADLGRTLITSAEIWSNAPEKVLAVRRDWAEQHEDVHLRMVQAMMMASQWIDQTDNRQTAARMISRPEYLDMPVELLLPSITGRDISTGGVLLRDMPDFCVFHRYAANYPWRSHAKWIVSEMIRWGETLVDIDTDIVAHNAYQPEIYRKAADVIGLPCPTEDEKLEGSHSHAWLLENATSPIAMGPDLFLDGRIFDPSVKARKSRLMEAEY